MEMRTLTYGKPRKSNGKLSEEKARMARQAEEAIGLASDVFALLKGRRGGPGAGSGAGESGETEVARTADQASRKEEFARALESYRDCIKKLAESRSIETWKLEREILPDELKNVRFAILGLPETVVPFSLSNSLSNGALEERLRDMPGRSTEMAVLARILDCYARVPLPPGLISEFYRPAAAELHLSRDAYGEGPEYLEAVLRLALELTGKHHNLKMDLHKNITTQTGDRLGQPNPEKKTLFKFRFEKKQSEDSIAASLRLRWGAPVTDGIPTGRRHVSPRKSEFESQLSPVAPEGSRAEWMFAHRDLPGMLFSSEQCAEAFSLVVNADFFTMRPNSKVKVPAVQTSLIEELRQTKEFRVATHMRDRRSQLKLTLETLQMELHVANILDANMATEAAEAWDMAREHFAKAYEWMAQFEKEKDQKQTAMTAVPVRRMVQIWSANKHMAPFDIALDVALEMRADRKSLTTVRPSFPEIAPAMLDSEPAASLKSPKPPTIPEEWIDPELEEALAEHGGERGELVRKHARKLRYLMAMGQAGEAGPEYRDALETLMERYSVGEVVRLASAMAGAELAEADEPGAEAAPLPPEMPEVEVEVDDEGDEVTSPGQLASTEEEPQAAAEPAEETRKSKSKTLIAFPPVSPKIAEPEEEVIADATAAEAAATPKPAKTLVLEQDELTQPALRPAALMLDRLGTEEKELVMTILGKAGPCTESGLEEFRALHPGVRDLRIRNMLSAVWTDGDWRGAPESGTPGGSDVLRSRFGNICSICALSPSTTDEMAQAARDPANLTVSQLALVGRFLGINPGNVTPAAIEMFGVWQSGDQRRLQAYWSANYPEVMRVTLLSQKMTTYNITSPPRRQFEQDELELLSKIFGKPVDKIDINDVKDVGTVTAYANRLQQFHQRWFSPSVSERQNYWRRGRMDIVSVASLAHRVHFIDDAQPAHEDSLILNAVYGRPPADRNELAQGIANVARALLYKGQDDQNNPKIRKYLPELLAINDTIFGQRNPVGNLLETARLQDEARTLGDFLGASMHRPHARLVSRDAACSPKYHEEMVDDPQGGSKRKVTHIGTHNTVNDDTISQAVVELPDGRVVELDLVADGMGGHSSGNIASGILRSVFEISTLMGLIETPEDVRRAIVMADLAITMETITGKRQNPRLKGYEDHITGREMGTTATVSLLCGDELFLIHIGDSPAELFNKNGELVWTTVGHSFVSEFLSTQGCTLDSNQPQLVAREITKHGTSLRTMDGSTRFIIHGNDFILASSDGSKTSFRITRNGQDVCQGEARPMLFEKLAEVLEIPNGNVITGAVGNTIRKTAINNQLKGYSPIRVEDGMLLSVTSDGISVPLCSHEIPLIVNNSGGDLQTAAGEIIRTAEARTPNGTNSFKPSCACDERGSKNDDKSVILKRLKKKS